MTEEDWFEVTVKVKGKAESYEKAGHGVKHRIISAGFKEENIKIESIRKLEDEEIDPCECPRCHQDYSACMCEDKDK
jgi:hypothetical protein